MLSVFLKNSYQASQQVNRPDPGKASFSPFFGRNVDSRQKDEVFFSGKRPITGWHELKKLAETDNLSTVTLQTAFSKQGDLVSALQKGITKYSDSNSAEREKLKKFSQHFNSI